jgi:hypothetical protein
MKTKMLALLAAAVLSTWAAAAPEAERVPPIVRSGLAAYKADGAQAAITAWMVGSPIALTEEPERELRALRQFESTFGNYQDFHVVRIATISATAQMVYVQLDYLNGPAFGKFLAFEAKGTWKIVRFNFGADPEIVWGLSLFNAPDMS